MSAKRLYQLQLIIVVALLIFFVTAVFQSFNTIKKAGKSLQM
jgi:hypothetical protein